MSLPIVGFEHLHLHTTHGSLLDGFGTCQEYANRWQYHGNFLCVSDHGMMAAIPHRVKKSCFEKTNVLFCLLAI